MTPEEIARLKDNALRRLSDIPEGSQERAQPEVIVKLCDDLIRVSEHLKWALTKIDPSKLGSLSSPDFNRYDEAKRLVG